MVIVGAKGFAKELLQIVAIENQEKLVFLFDNVTADIEDKLYNKFDILKSLTEVKNNFQMNNDSRFVLGIGVPTHRKNLSALFESEGGMLTSIIAGDVKIGSFDTTISKGCTIMSGTVITNSVHLGKGCLINLNCTVGHDSVIGDFVELSPNVNVSGNCTIKTMTTIGTNAIILPNLTIGENCIIGAGTLVTKDVPDNVVVVGVPGKIIRKNN